MVRSRKVWRRISRRPARLFDSVLGGTSIRHHNCEASGELPMNAMSVRMYTTQVCPYCVRAKALLRQRGVPEIEEIRIDLDPARRDEMMQITGRRTVPQIFIGTTHIGGCDDLIALDQRGGLATLLGTT
jgi:glutaredoxin 3